MNKIAPIGIILAFVAIAVAFIPKPVITDEGDSEATHINWVSMEKVEELIMTKPRPVLVDVYTDWCGWCKKMDKDT
ncbi:MAG: thioredoxin domain-containing protein, partial [Bacteroidia bacterium]